MFISFLLCCAGKRKEMNQRKEKPALYKRDFKTQKQKFPSTAKPDRHAVRGKAEPSAYVKGYVQEPETSVFQDRSF